MVTIFVSAWAFLLQKLVTKFFYFNDERCHFLSPRNQDVTDSKDGYRLGMVVRVTAMYCVFKHARKLSDHHEVVYTK